MKVTYDPEADAVRISLRNASVDSSDELREGIIVDYDAAGEIVAFEILDASERLDEPDAIHFGILREAATTPA